MPRADVDIFFSTNKPAFAYVDGGEAVGEASAVAADEGAGQVGVNADLTGASISGLASKPSAQEPGTSITVNSDTFHSIGITWELEPSEDTGHTSSVAVRYRKPGNSWSNASNLMRNDYQWFWTDNYPPVQPAITNFSGSIMFLTPGQVYEVELTYTGPGDPQDGRVVTFQTSTRAIPVKPTGGRALFVVPGSGGGDGSDLNPFQGLDAANAAAIPGDTFLLRNGTYSKATLSTSGGENNHIVYEPDLASQGAVIDSLVISGDHIWIDNLDFAFNDLTGGATPIQDQGWQATSGIYVPPPSPDVNPDDVIITNNTFTGFYDAILSLFAISRWVVMDNDIVGWRPEGVGGTPPVGGEGSGGRGIGIGAENSWQRANGVIPTHPPPSCVVAFNNITRHTDGIGVYEDCDIYGNRVWDGAGNALSMDGSYGNVRVWGNIFQYSRGAPMSWQPQRIGPWYWLYNQFGQAQNGVFKQRTMDRSVLINNTFFDDDGNLSGKANTFLRNFSRNNLFIGGGSTTVWNETGGTAPPDGNIPQLQADWNTDIDYNGFASGHPTNVVFWNGVNYTLPEWAALVSNPTLGIYPEVNSIMVDPNLIFDDYTPDPQVSLELASGTNAAVDAGILVDNLSDWSGTTPDLGAHQRGAAALFYGPRPQLVLTDKTLYWDKH